MTEYPVNMDVTPSSVSGHLIRDEYDQLYFRDPEVAQRACAISDSIRIFDYAAGGSPI